MDEIELPTTEVRDWIARASLDCGHPADVADALGYSAWWLENRGMRGVLRVVTYLLMIHGRDYPDLQPKARDDKVVCLCPITCAVLIASQIEGDKAKFSQWVGGFATADPVLMAPIIARVLDYEFDVLLRYYDQDLRFSETGVTLYSESLAALYLTDSKEGVETGIRLAVRNEDRPTFEYHRKDTLGLPRFRYLDGGGFRFD